MSIGPWTSKKTVNITLPVEGIALSFFIYAHIFFINFQPVWLLRSVEPFHLNTPRASKEAE